MAVAFLLYIIIEVAAIWAVMSTMGLLWTVVALVGGTLLGTWLVRREGSKALRAVLQAARRRAPVHREITDGMLVAFGGLLILLPGFVSDIAGLLVLLPPTRGLIGRRLVRSLERRIPGMRRNPKHMVVDGEVLNEQPATDRPEIDPSS